MGETFDTTEFDDLVALYERVAEPVTRPFAVRALAMAGLARGARVIDVAAGTGVLALAAAEAGARVLATDLAPAMAARAAERLRPFEGCGARAMGFDALAVPDARFDAAFSIMGVLLFPTWRDGLRELLRVTRPGGRIALAAWTRARDAAPAFLVKRVFEARFPGRELCPSGSVVAWTGDGLRDALREAGCEAVEVEVHRGSWDPRSPSGAAQAPAQALDEGEAMFRMFPGYAAMTPAEHGSLRADLVRALAAYADPGGAIRVPTEAFVAVARRPA